MRRTVSWRFKMMNHYLRARGLLWGVRHDLLGEAYAPTEEDVEGLMQAFVRLRDQSLMELRSLAVKLGVTDRWRAAIDKEIAGTSSEG